MNKIQNTFAKGKVLIGHLTAGDPTIEKSAEFLLEMERAGVDIIELGIPFSDPIAEGPAQQLSNIRSLSAGTTIDKIFNMMADIREKTEIPVIFYTYLNPLFNYGYEAFFKKCQEVGISGIYIPDLSFEEKAEVNDVAAAYGVAVISLITPAPAERIKMIAENASGFIYAASTMSNSGIRPEIVADPIAILKLIKEHASCPAVVEFSACTPEQAERIGKHADGILNGNAIVKLVEMYGENATPYIYDYLKSIKDAMLK